MANKDSTLNDNQTTLDAHILRLFRVEESYLLDITLNVELLSWQGRNLRKMMEAPDQFRNQLIRSCNHSHRLYAHHVPEPTPITSYSNTNTPEKPYLTS